MSISDPAQLLQRVPELHALSDDPKIRHAIESGDPFKVYRALMLARLTRRLPAQRELLKELTGERRLFAKPLKGTPSLGTLNSVGFSFVGNAEQDSDGSHIALHAFVVMYALPLIPLGAYVVQSTGSRSWQIYARAPLGIAGWLYTRGVAAAMVLLVMSGAVHSIHAAGHQDLLLLNGFDQPLTVDLGKQSVTVPAQGRLSVSAVSGKLHATASGARGGVIDTLDTDLASSDRLSIWNIAGATPLERNTITYSRTPQASASAPPGSQTVYCGQRFIELYSVRYQFEEPPKTMSMSKHQDTVSVEQIDIATSPNATGAVMCSNYLADQNQPKAAALLLTAQAQLKNWDLELTYPAIFATQAVSDTDAIALARRALQARPENLRLARLLQDMRRDAGQADAQLEEHRARAQAHPDVAAEQYLYASLLTGKTGIDRMQALSEQFPKEPAILRSLTWRKANHGDPAGALRELARLRALSAAEADAMVDVEVRALAALQRGPDAMQLLEARSHQKAATHREDDAREYAQLARLAKGDPERLLAQLQGDAANPVSLDFERISAGLPQRDPASSTYPLVKMVLALRSTPRDALTIAASMERTKLMSLPESHRALLYGEAIRTGQMGVVRAMHGLLGVRGREEQLLQQYLRGEPVLIENIDVNLDTLAAAAFIRSRNTSLPSSERAALRNLAARSDVLHGVVSTAMNQWQG